MKKSEAVLAVREHVRRHLPEYAHRDAHPAWVVLFGQPVAGAGDQESACKALAAISLVAPHPDYVIVDR